MYCNNCGHQSQEDFQFCPRCGTSVQNNPYQSDPYQSTPYQADPIPNAAYQEAYSSVNPAAQTFLSLLQDKLFFVICILMTVKSGVSVLMGNLPVVDILIAVFLWLVHAQASKNIADAGYLRCVSGAVYANYVVFNVCAVIFAVCGLILGATFSIFAGNTDFIQALQRALAESAYISINGVTSTLSMLSGGFFMVVFLIAAALMFACNFFTIRYIHRFAKSVYKSIQSGVTELKHVSATRVVLIIFAIFAGIDALGSFSLLGLLCNGANCGACILAVLLMNKYLIPKN